METTKVLTSTQSDNGRHRRNMRHFLVPQNTTDPVSHSSDHFSSLAAKSRRSSVPSLYSHYLTRQRKFGHLKPSNSTRNRENGDNYVCDQPMSSEVLGESRLPPKSFGLWFPTVQAASPASSTSTLFTSGSSSPSGKDTSKPVTSSANRSTTNSSSGQQASAHCLAASANASSAVFTSPPSPSSSVASASSARVNLMSNSAVAAIQQQPQLSSFLLSLSRLAALAQPFTPSLAFSPPAPVTIKLINNSHPGSNSGGSGGSSTGAPSSSSTFFGQEEKRDKLKTASTTAVSSSFEQQCSQARPRPPESVETAEHQQVPPYPHRHSSIYESFDQQSSSSSPTYHQANHHLLQQYQSPSLSFSFHPSLLPQQQQHPYFATHRPTVNDSSNGNQQQHHFSLIHHQFNHLTLAEKERFERLFRELDINGNGFIDFNDLVHTLEAKGIRATHDNVKDIIERSDRNADGDIDFAEFVTYCLENEKKLHVLFKDIDLNDDGKIDESELVHAFEKVGVEVDQEEALRLVQRIKDQQNLKNGQALEINFEEFRDFLLLHPTDSLHGLMRSWRHGTFVDLGEDGLMPVDFSENEIRTGMWWRHLIAGGVAGAVSRTATAPLDRLKVFLQVRGAEFNGLSVCLRHMIAEGGVISLWRGNGINVLKIAPETAIKFMAFDQMKRWIHSNKSTDITVMERFLAGSAAGAISQTVIYPMEVLKTRFCLRSTGQYTGLMDAAAKINAQGGLRNFYRGYVPNLLGIIPYAGIDLTIYETLKKTYLLHNSLEEAPIFVCLACGTISSTFGQIASYPLALVRTRMQSELGFHRSSMYGMFRSIYAKEGPKGLYRGITANIMKVAPAVSISYVVYEYTRRPLGAIMS